MGYKIDVWQSRPGRWVWAVLFYDGHRTHRLDCTLPRRTRTAAEEAAARARDAWERKRTN